jgi:hypothetical protein
VREEKATPKGSLEGNGEALREAAFEVKDDASLPHHTFLRNGESCNLPCEDPKFGSSNLVQMRA